MGTATLLTPTQQDSSISSIFQRWNLRPRKAKWFVHKLHSYKQGSQPLNSHLPGTEASPGSARGPLASLHSARGTTRWLPPRASPGHGQSSLVKLTFSQTVQILLGEQRALPTWRQIRSHLKSVPLKQSQGLKAFTEPHASQSSICH